MGIRHIVKLFQKRNVCVVGEIGTGKDMLMGNVIARRCKPYVSNIDYTSGKNYHQLDFHKLGLGGNTYRDFISGNVKYYCFDDFYPLGSDIYISDVGVYFPAQYCNLLNNEYKDFIMFPSLSRHAGRSRIHCNCQVLNRIWDKLREQSGCYIRCISCFVFLGFVFQRVYIYDNYDACVRRVKPFSVRVGLTTGLSRTTINLEKLKFEERNGLVESRFLIYRNRAKYDTHHFYSLMKGGVKK